MERTCKDCGAKLIQLLEIWVCPNECDKLDTPLVKNKPDNLDKMQLYVQTESYIDYEGGKRESVEFARIEFVLKE